MIANVFLAFRSCLLCGATCLQSFDIELHATNLLLLQSSHMKQHKKEIHVAGGGDLDIWSRILLKILLVWWKIFACLTNIYYSWGFLYICTIYITHGVFFIFAQYISLVVAAQLCEFELVQHSGGESQVWTK